MRLLDMLSAPEYLGLMAYGTSIGVTKAWDTRGRGRKHPLVQALINRGYKYTEPIKSGRFHLSGTTWKVIGHRYTAPDGHEVHITREDGKLQWAHYHGPNVTTGGNDVNSLEKELAAPAASSPPEQKRTLNDMSDSDTLKSLYKRTGGKFNSDGDVLTLGKPVTLYHVTDAQNEKGIMRRGLVPSAPSRSDEAEMNAPTGVYLGTKQAIGYYKDAVREAGGRPLVLSVTLPAGTKVEEDPMNETDYFVRAKINPSNIKKGS